MWRPFTLLAPAALLASCATLVHPDSHERIPVTSDPAGAVVSVDCGSLPVYGGVTPVTLTIQRKADPCVFTVSKEGYKPHSVELSRELTRAAEGNQVPGAVVGGVAWIISFLAGEPGVAVYQAGREAGSAPGNAIDERTGAMYKHVPGEVHVVLVPAPPGER
jgi:hypothetical protein